MVRDLMIDIKERDLVFSDTSNQSIPMFEVVWGDLFEFDLYNDFQICNIIVPEAFWGDIEYDENLELICKFHSAYRPNLDHFMIRPVKLRDGYSLFDMRNPSGVPAYSYARNKNCAERISAAMLSFVDIDGEFLVKFVRGKTSEVFDRAYIYSSKETDIEIGFSDNQSALLLSLNVPGSLYRYPTTGVGSMRYLNTVVEHTDFMNVLESQFEADGKPIYKAEFDNATGDLDLQFSPEVEKNENLASIENLSGEFFDVFTDENVRRQNVITELSDLNYIDLLRSYANFLNVLFFPDTTTEAYRVVGDVTPGRFNVDNEIEDDPAYCIVSAKIPGNSIIMFDDETIELNDQRPVFLINDLDKTNLYQSLIGQTYWISEACKKCFILLRGAVVRYVMLRSQYQAGKGLFVIPETSNNVKNLLSIVQDEHTGRIVSVVASKTNISDVVIDEVTQRIYAIKDCI